MSLLKAKAVSKPKTDEARGWAFAGLSDVGRTRAHNEDCISVKNDLQLVVLADGMGGYQAGEVASKIAVDVVVAEITESKLTEKDIARIDPDTGISIAMAS
jgi:serine/threonine protein phosphatase PrpC